MTRVLDHYSIDTSALLHGWRRVYRPRNFGFVWRGLSSLITEGRLHASREVHEELKKKDDDVTEWCKDKAKDLFIEIDDACQNEVARLMGLYPRLVDTTKGRSGGDPFVIALALSAKPHMIVVTEELPGKVRIPDVCFQERITCIGLADLIEREDWQAG